MRLEEQKIANKQAEEKAKMLAWESKKEAFLTYMKGNKYAVECDYRCGENGVWDFKAQMPSGKFSAKSLEKDGIEIAKQAVSWIEQNGTPEFFNPENRDLQLTVNLFESEKGDTDSLGQVEYTTVRDAFVWIPAQYEILNY
jgi:hypothetical protein